MTRETKPDRVILATRRSPLARWQALAVRGRLTQTFPDLRVSTKVILTEGDRKLDQSLPAIGGKGLFTEALDQALRDRSVDLAVHSLKDLPIEDSPGLTIGAIPLRADPRDVLIARDGSTLEALPLGSVVGTSSPRRQAQLLAYRPDLNIRWMRGNVGTRVRKVLNGEYDAAILAAAGVLRLGLQDHVTAWIPHEVMLPAPGQGALAVQCRSEDADMLRLLAALDDPEVRAAVEAERAFLACLGSGCSTPVGAYGTRLNGRLVLKGAVLSADGGRAVRVEAEGVDPEALGRELADRAIAQGALEIMAHG